MKKFTTILTLGALALALTACGSNNAENVETEMSATDASQSGDSEETADDAEAIPLPDEYEAQVFEGIASDVSSNRVTLTDTEGNSQTFDLSSAEKDEDMAILSGSDVEVEYAVVDGSDVYPAAYVTVLMDIEQQADIENRDPVIYGKLQIMDINDVTIIDESGTERTFDNQMSRTVSFSDIKTGDTVAITYCGSLFDVEEEGVDEDNDFSTPIALKIVAEDAVDSEDAQANYFTGTVDGFFGGGVVQVTNDVASFEVVADEATINSISEEDQVRVYYSGALSGISVDATSIEKIDG